MVHQSQRQSAEKQKKLLAFQSQQSVAPYDPTTYFFNKFGSSFNQLQAPLTNATSADNGDDEEPATKLRLPLKYVKVIRTQYQLPKIRMKQFLNVFLFFSFS